MDISTIIVLLWLHVLSMVGAFGVLLALQLALPAGTRDSAPVAQRCSRLLNALVALGFLTGLSVFVLKMSAFKAAGNELTGAYHGLIGTKILILLAVGACVGMAPALLRKGRPGVAHMLRTAAMTLLVVAALMGFMLVR